MHGPGGHATQHGLADGGLAAQPAAEEQVVSPQPLAALAPFAQGRGLEADVADPVVGAGVGAAVEVQPQAPRPVAEDPFHVPDDLFHLGLGLPDGVVAEGLARARDAGTAQVVDLHGEADVGHRAGDGLQPVLRYVREDDVLAAGQPELAPVLAGQVGQPDHLRAGAHAQEDGEAGVEQPGPHLFMDPGVIEFRLRRFRRRAIGQPVSQARFHPFPVGFRPQVGDHELQPRLHAGHAVLEVLFPHVDDGAQHGDHVVHGNEDAHVAREAGPGGQAAADPDREPVVSLPDDAQQADAVDLGRVALVGAAGDGDLVLAGQIAVIGIAVEEIGHRLDDRTGVEQFVGGQSRHRAARDVPHRVAATAARGQPGPVQRREDLWQVVQLHAVELDVLPRGQLAVVAPAVLGDPADGAQLVRRQASARQLDPHHEVPHLGLVVVQAVPLQAHHVLLRNLLVALLDQVRDVVNDLHRRLLVLEPLHVIALPDQFPGGFRLLPTRPADRLRHARTPIS